MICPYHARVDDARPCVQADRTTDRIGERHSKPNPVHNMPNRNMPDRNMSANHDTTTNPQNTNSPTHNDNQPPSDEPLRPPESADQIGNRNHKTNPVHNRPTSRVPTDHGTTANPQNTNNPISTRRTATGTPATQPTKSADQTANHTTTSEPVHTDAHQHRATNHNTPTKPQNTNVLLVARQSVSAK